MVTKKNDSSKFTGEGEAYIRMLVYPIQFESNPLDGVDRVIEHVIDADSEEVFIEHITSALACDKELSKLIPQEHPEEAIRQYLTEIKNRLMRQD